MEKLLEENASLKNELMRTKQENILLREKIQELLVMNQRGPMPPRGPNLSPEIMELVNAGVINMNEARNQQRLWKHRECSNGNCKHRNHGGEPTYEQLLEIGEKIGTVNIGLSEFEIQQIPVISVDSGDCSICQSEVFGEAKELRCGHIYHVSCIAQWLANKKKCPICYALVKE